MCSFSSHGLVPSNLLWFRFLDQWARFPPSELGQRRLSDRHVLLVVAWTSDAVLTLDCYEQVFRRMGLCRTSDSCAAMAHSRRLLQGPVLLAICGESKVNPEQCCRYLCCLRSAEFQSES
jgi:hypothetical protein